MTPVRLEPAAPRSRVKHSTTELPVKLEDLHLILRENASLVWTCGELYSGAVKKACDIQVGGRRGPGRPKLT